MNSSASASSPLRLDHNNPQDNDWNNNPLSSNEPKSSTSYIPTRTSLLMRFCPHDSSMLYPKEHKSSKTLLYACRLCPYTESSHDQPMIYRNVIKKEVNNVLSQVSGAIADDPTLPRSQNASCENCGHPEAVFFQSDTGQSDTLALIFVCCSCEHRWVK